MNHSIQIPDLGTIDLCLASASPRRAELIGKLGLRPWIFPVDIDEAVQHGESPDAYVSRLAIEKAKTGYARHQQPLVTLGSDTSVVIDDQILGKPLDEAHAIEMLMQLSNRIHHVLTSVAIITPDGEYAALSTSEVHFKPLTVAECQAYWRTGEPADKAGAYGIQALGSTFVRHISGSFTGVMGLPLYETAQLLHKAKLPIMNFTD